MLDTPFPPWPCFTEEETEAVRRVLESNRVNYWTGGQGRDFEREFAAFTDTRHAVALANGTLALDAALQALGLGPRDEVIVTPRTVHPEWSVRVEVATGSYDPSRTEIHGEIRPS